MPGSGVALLGACVVVDQLRGYAVHMTGTRWFPVEDYGAKDHRVRLRDALWGGLATLRDPDGTLRDPLVFKSRQEAFAWLSTCAKAWDSGAVPSPPRFAHMCENCRQKTGRPIVWETGMGTSGPVVVERAYCPPCAATLLSPPILMMLKRTHESICARCRDRKRCHIREPIVDAYDAAFRISSARNLGR